MDIVNLIISLISGVAGGNLAGSAMSDKSLGALGNSITGLLGGGAGYYVLQALGLFATLASHASGTPAPEAAQHTLDLGSILGNVAGSGVGGALLTAVAGWIKNAANKS